MSRELAKSAAVGNACTAHDRAIKRVAETARTASAVLEKMLMKEFVSTTEREKKWQ